LKPAHPRAHRVFGGQGTINVNSWSPDSKKFAFVATSHRFRYAPR